MGMRWDLCVLCESILMASLERRGNSFRVVCWLQGKRVNVALTTDDPEEAESLCSRVQHRLRLLARGDLTMPDGAHLETWLLSDGKLSQPIAPPTSDKPKTLHDLFDRYFAKLPPGANEKSTLGSMQTHRKHLED